MMSATIDRNAAEVCLIRMLNMIRRSGIRSMSSLRAVPALYNGYMTALHTWMISVGFTTSACASIIRSHNVSAEDMAGDLLTRLLNPERRICRKKNRTLAQSVNASLHPAMDYALNMAVESDANTVVRYLMRVIRNFCVEKFRKDREENERTVHSDPETLRHGDADAQDVGGVKKHPTSAVTDSEMMRRQRMAAAFSCFDNDFLHDASLLGDALGVPRQKLASIIYSGRSYPLACQMVTRINELLGGDYTDAFTPFLHSAHSYRLPEKYQQDMDSFLRRLYRATSSDSRLKMKTRIIAAIA